MIIQEQKTKEDFLKASISVTNWNFLVTVLHSGVVYKQILEAMQQYADQQTTLTESQRKEWADTAIKKQGRIEELEEGLKKAVVLINKMITDQNPEEVMDTYNKLSEFVQSTDSLLPIL